ncbi:hypothetical protein [Streptomyces sp. NPDC050287]|uniref:hypothetical protein n=1 Tax=Streptomyces sp. NPDC050287 TaxID=3365608 RepID=UPI0037B15A91
MADEQYRWLDRETAERLLSGESLEDVGMAARDQAERLAKTLDALTVEPPPTSAELPGEAAALAAFRAARVDRVDDWVSDRAVERTASGHRSGDCPADAAVVRIGGPDRGGPRPRRGRTVRFGLAAALAVGMVGGVAVAAGTGVLPTRFGEAEPDPAASVSAAVTPDGPLVSPSSGTAPRETPSSDAGTGPGGSHDTAGGGSAPAPGATPGSEGRTGGPGRAWPGALSACRDMRDGKGLAAGRRHTLEGAAGGSSYVKKYCKELLADPSSGKDDGKGRTKKNDKNDKNDKGDKDAQDGKADDGGHRGDQGKHHRDGDRGRDGDADGGKGKEKGGGGTAGQRGPGGGQGGRSSR